MKNWTIIFDLDGTLIDTVPDVCRSLNVALAEHGRRAHSVDEVRNYMGRGARIMMERALEATGDVPSGETIDRITSEFLNDYAENPVGDSTLYPYVFEVLEQLADSGAILGICTNKPSITAFPVLSAFGLDKQFSTIICGDQTETPKPSGSHILETIDKASGQPATSIMVGDSENDIDAAKDANIPSVAVTFGYSLKEHHELGANELIDCYDQLVPAIYKIISDA